jgi:hypothetical protein
MSVNVVQSSQSLGCSPLSQSGWCTGVLKIRLPGTEHTKKAENKYPGSGSRDLTGEEWVWNTFWESTWEQQDAR